ncbi:MAG: hypothetical protein JO015_08020 [Verrucomicrobia bacterium]|nr:hypothetical protein [Verrucomicrobiota bacterium]
MQNPTTPTVTAGPTETKSVATPMIAVHLNPVHQRRLKQVCDVQHLSPDELLIKALEAYLEAHIK